ncbi:MAG TPA: hypothetical protein VEW08_01615 [Steroidobacteraceae bacterium]|nr:hypothetical protein [Steroidobacteraceae bacterium]
MRADSLAMLVSADGARTIYSTSGYVVLVSIAGSPASAALMNVDAPLILMSLGTSSNAFRGLAVVAR